MPRSVDRRASPSRMPAPPSAERPLRRRGATFLALLPLLGGCAVVGYPSPAPPAPGPQGEPPPAGRSRPAAGPVVVSDPAPSAAEADETPATSLSPVTYEVFGERYTVLESAEGYREVGLASWYGREFAGRPTSSGEIFDPEGMTAAHRSLPLSTWVEVTNLENGRAVVLRINDRGPFVDTDERIIDVSHGAARLLGLVGPGISRVEVRALATPATGGAGRR